MSLNHSLDVSNKYEEQFPRCKINDGQSGGAGPSLIEKKKSKTIHKKYFLPS